MAASDGLAVRVRRSIGLWGYVAIYLGGAWAFWGVIILFDWYRVLWTGYVLPNLQILLPVLAGFELLLAGLVLSRGRRARLGHGIGAAFQVVLAPLGFWWPANAVLAAGHGLLSRYQFRVALIANLRRRLRGSA